jgi:MFS family permease
VAENGIMQRRTPDAVRSRTMAAFEAVISLGLAVSYIVAGPMLNAVGPQGTYLIGGVAALAAAVMLAPLRRLRQTGEPDEVPSPAAPGSAVLGEPVVPQPLVAEPQVQATPGVDPLVTEPLAAEAPTGRTASDRDVSQR